MEPILLQTPLSEEGVRSLKAGDVVKITGTLWTARSRFHSYFIEEGHQPPVDSRQHNVMLHSGPIMERVADTWRLRALSITSSIRFEHWEPEVIRRLGLRAIIGKGRMGRATAEAMQEFGCVHLTRTGGLSGAYATMVERVKEVHWLELGLPEALWVLEVRDFGPLVVEIDTQGNCLYEGVQEGVHANMERVYQSLGIADLAYAEK